MDMIIYVPCYAGQTIVVVSLKILDKIRVLIISFNLSYRLYYTQILVGNPPRPYHLDMDTGSDLTWIQCDAPCSSCAKVPPNLSIFYQDFFLVLLIIVKSYSLSNDISLCRERILCINPPEVILYTLKTCCARRSREIRKAGIVKHVSSVTTRFSMRTVAPPWGFLQKMDFVW